MVNINDLKEFENALENYQRNAGKEERRESELVQGFKMFVEDSEDKIDCNDVLKFEVLARAKFKDYVKDTYFVESKCLISTRDIFEIAEDVLLFDFNLLCDDVYNIIREGDIIEI